MNKTLATRPTEVANTTNSTQNITANTNYIFATEGDNIGYVAGKLLRQALDAVWNYFFPPAESTQLNYEKLHTHLISSFDMRLNYAHHLSADKVAEIFHKHLKSLPPFQKQQLPRVHKDLYGVLRRHEKQPQRLEMIVEEIPEFKKHYKADLEKAFSEKMRRFEKKFKALFPKHKTYDETADYIKHFLSKLSTYEKEIAPKKVLKILKETVRENLGNCDDSFNNCAWEIGYYTIRIPELDDLHKPSSYGYIEGATWSQVGVDKLSKEAQITAMKHTQAALSGKSTDKEVELVKRLYPEPIRRIFGDPNTSSEIIAQIPVIDVGDAVGFTGYVDYLHPKHLTSNVMRGVDKYHRPFIVFCVENAEGEEVAEAVFQRYRDDPENWALGCHKVTHLFRRSYPLHEENIEYGRRLVNGEPCGIRYFGEEERQLTNENGKSTISLCNRN